MRATVRGWRIAVSVGTVVLTAVAVGLFAAAHRRALSETFRGQGIAFAVAFADAAEEWLASGDTEAIQRAARLMFLGSVLYVQVFSADALQVDERRGSLAEAGTCLAYLESTAEARSSQRSLGVKIQSA